METLTQERAVGPHDCNASLPADAVADRDAAASRALLLHLTPRCCGPLGRYEAELVQLTAPDLGLYLERGRDLVTRKPYPNKAYSVGCRNGGKAENGLLIECLQVPRDRRIVFTTTAVWAITFDNRTWYATHETEYVLLDDEGDAASDCTAMWYGFGDWPSRWPDVLATGAQSRAKPCFDVFHIGDDADDVVDTLFPQGTDGVIHGAVKHRRTVFYMPTLQRARLDAWRRFSKDWPLPPERSAFTV